MTSETDVLLKVFANKFSLSFSQVFFGSWAVRERDSSSESIVSFNISLYYAADLFLSTAVYFFESLKLSLIVKRSCRSFLCFFFFSRTIPHTKLVRYTYAWTCFFFSYLISRGKEQFCSSYFATFFLPLAPGVFFGPFRCVRKALCSS